VQIEVDRLALLAEVILLELDLVGAAGLKSSNWSPRPSPAWLMSVSSASISERLGSCLTSAPNDCSTSFSCCT